MTWWWDGTEPGSWGRGTTEIWARREKITVPTVFRFRINAAGLFNKQTKPKLG